MGPSIDFQNILIYLFKVFLYVEKNCLIHEYMNIIIEWDAHMCYVTFNHIWIILQTCEFSSQTFIFLSKKESAEIIISHKSDNKFNKYISLTIIYISLTIM